MNTMIYKGYPARIEFDDRDNIFIGRLVGVSDVVGFHGDTVADLRAAFEEAVDDYLETCEKIGKTPDKPASGKMVLRIPPEIHTAAMTAAKLAGLSLNKWAADVFKKAVNS